MKTFPYSDTNKRYHTQSYFLKNKFGCKVMKIPLNAGCTCPNIDGTKGTGGCSFCSAGSSRFAGDPALSLTEQFYAVRKMMERKWSGKFIPYFQSNSNTYTTAEKLRSMIEEVIDLPDVVGISVSTRPDCINPDIADYLGDVAKQTFLTVELGLQSIYDTTLRHINRCHSYSDFLDAVDMLNRYGINIAVHIIDGLPGETPDMMLNTVSELSRLPIHSVKIHLLHVLKNTRLAIEYENSGFEVLSMEKYVDIVVSQLRLLPPETVIGRLTGDGARDELIAPLWSLKKFVVMNEIDKLMAANDYIQGDLYIK